MVPFNDLEWPADPNFNDMPLFDVEYLRNKKDRDIITYTLRIHCNFM